MCIRDRVSTLAGDYLFGDQQVSKNGISIALMPLDPQKSDIGIPDYPLHDLFGMKQNYLNLNIYSEYSQSFNNAHNAKVMLGFQTEDMKQE